MSCPGVMLETGGMGDQRSLHAVILGSTARLHGRLGGLEADLRMLAVTEWFRRRVAAAAQEDPMLAGHIIEVAVAVAQLELAEIARDQIGTVLGGNHFNRHGLLLFRCVCENCDTTSISLLDIFH